MDRLMVARSGVVSKLVIPLVAMGCMAVAACGGSSTPSPRATSSPGASSPGASSAGAFDTCLVGTWTVVAQD